MWLSLLLAVCASGESGKLQVFFLQLPVGQESYELKDGMLNAVFGYTERGSRVALEATLKMRSDLTPEHFEAHGRSYRPFTVDASVTPQNVSGPFFTISGYSPFSVQMMMLRYWLAHGKPVHLPQKPGGPPIEIHRTGEDIIHNDVRLARYSISNVVWGRETVWLNEKQEIAAASTYAGNLPLEAIREEYLDAFSQLMKRAIDDRGAELHNLSDRIKPVAKDAFAIVGARLIDGTGAVVENATVVVRDGRIASIGQPVTGGIPIINASGQTLLPGLWEMHAHFAQVEYGPAYLAAGVTTARDCGGEFEFVTAARDAINNGALGPRLVLAGLVDGSGTGTFGVNWADTPEQGRAMVAKYKAAGFAQMKIYNRIKPDVLKEITREAHLQGMTVTGHVPEGMTAFQAVETGMDQINHIGPVLQEIRAVGLQQAVAFFKDHKTVVDPTLAWNELLGHQKDAGIASFEPGFAKAPYTLRSMIGTASGQGARMDPSFEAIRALHAAGVPIVAGTDKAVPAHSLHRELELYVQAGLTPMQVIQLATLGSARVMAMDADVGSIEVGKRADLILVAGNPLEHFLDLRKVVRVVKDGRVYDPAELWRSVGFEP
jgi:imidazolonepropionase-like amidohydrolase